jgi:hypothetical protein
MIPANSIIQAAYVVDDLEEAMARWRRLIPDLGPFFVMRDNKLEGLIYRGQPSEPFRADCSFAQAGSMQIELIQVNSSGPNLYRDTVPAGTDGYHHHAYFTDDIDAEFERFAAMGIEVATQGSYGNLRYAYFDTHDLIGGMTEVLQRDPMIEGMFQMIADAAIDWDGSDPVRLIS